MATGDRAGSIASGDRGTHTSYTAEDDAKHSQLVPCMLPRPGYTGPWLPCEPAVGLGGSRAGNFNVAAKELVDIGVLAAPSSSDVSTQTVATRSCEVQTVDDFTSGSGVASACSESDEESTGDVPTFHLDSQFDDAINMVLRAVECGDVPAGSDAVSLSAALIAIKGTPDERDKFQALGALSTALSGSVTAHGNGL